ncbi:hypothetical protein [Phyllobacterium chamaecytisi]|uniref:hypothetical protein n=1 Tax=Phyllobacterium chamaecytisi TaxID=2876082 RepID=UPI001CCFD99E|nr:hypothetical protein [Phyllobacterium sp. KW56]MBZ9601369.1 hypothetical protein [Phyllobacterium sp. KW56]
MRRANGIPKIRGLKEDALLGNTEPGNGKLVDGRVRLLGLHFITASGESRPKIATDGPCSENRNTPDRASRK